MNPAKWEEEFDKKFPVLDFSTDEGKYSYHSYSVEDIKVFIRETLLSHQAEMVRKLESLRKDLEIEMEGEPEHFHECIGHNAALDAAIALIKGV